MRLLLDAQSIQGSARHRGLGRYTLEFVAGVARNPEVTQCSVLLNGGVPPEQLFESREMIRRRAPGAQVVVFDAPWPWAAGNALEPQDHRDAEYVRDRLIDEMAPDAVVVCSPFASPYESVIAVPERGSRPFTATIVFDMLQFVDPDSKVPASSQAWLDDRLASVLNCDLALSISDFTATALRSFVGDRAPKTVTIHGAAFPMPAPPPVRRANIVVAGGDGRRKNEAATVRAFARLPRHVRAGHRLVVVGRQTNPDLDPVRVAQAAGLAPDEYIVLGQEISDLELSRHYASALVVVMPSRGEGLGLPVLEGWAAGAAAIASDVTSLPELVGDPRYLFPPDDIKAQAAVLHRLLADPQELAAAVEYGRKRSALFTWDETARRAIGAIRAGLDAAPVRTVPAGSKRPSLALVSPWPPQGTGIAAHARALAEPLGQHYKVTLVNSDPAAAQSARESGLDVVSAKDLDPGSFDRIVLQYGNNPAFHQDSVDVARTASGVAVLHDLDLLHLINHGQKVYPGGLAGLQFISGGLAGIGAATHASGAELVESARGVIVHSSFAQSVLVEEGHVSDPRRVAVAPLVVCTPANPDSESARQRLGIPPETVVVATFGRVEPEKGVDVFAGACSNLARLGHEFIGVVVGATNNLPYLRSLRDEYGDESLIFTGTVAGSQYSDWLAAADIAVQLRPGYRGETSAALIEALAAGCACVVESVGAMQELSELGVLTIPGPVTAAALSEVLAGLLEDPDRRARIGAQGLAAGHRFAPNHVADEYARIIESHYARAESPGIGRTAAMRLSKYLAANRTLTAKSRILFDVSSLVETDRRTGIERVMSALAQATARESDQAVYPVRIKDGSFVLAPEVVRELLDDSGREALSWTLDDFGDLAKPVVWRDGDVLICGENKNDPTQWATAIADARGRGAKYVQITYDLLPLQMPDFFPAFVEPWFRDWLQVVAANADLILCDSQTVAADLEEWLAGHAPGSTHPAVSWIRLAGNLTGERDLSHLRLRARGRRRVLMVGTVEPRKGHDVLLDAAYALWERGQDVEFVVVGRQGWALPETIARLRHASAHDRLVWLDDADDGALRWEYLSADLLVMASRGEGFGLPIVEALAHGVPVVARDLPVFRELLGEDGDYFTLDGQLADVISRRLASDEPIKYVPDRLVTWRETAADLLAAIDSVTGR